MHECLRVDIESVLINFKQTSFQQLSSFPLTFVQQSFTQSLFQSAKRESTEG